MKLKPNAWPAGARRYIDKHVEPFGHIKSLQTLYIQGLWQFWPCQKLRNVTCINTWRSLAVSKASKPHVYQHLMPNSPRTPPQMCHELWWMLGSVAKSTNKKEWKVSHLSFFHLFMFLATLTQNVCCEVKLAKLGQNCILVQNYFSKDERISVIKVCEW